MKVFENTDMKQKLESNVHISSDEVFWWNADGDRSNEYYYENDFIPIVTSPSISIPSTDAESSTSNPTTHHTPQRKRTCASSTPKSRHTSLSPSNTHKLKKKSFSSEHHLYSIPHTPPNVTSVYIGGTSESSSINTKERSSSFDECQRYGTKDLSSAKPPIRPVLSSNHLMKRIIPSTASDIDQNIQSLTRPRKKVQRSLTLTSFRKDKNNYVALPATEALRRNVYSSSKIKKKLSFQTSKYAKISKEVIGDDPFFFQPLHQRTRSHDELMYAYKEVQTNDFLASIFREGMSDDDDFDDGDDDFEVVDTYHSHTAQESRSNNVLYDDGHSSIYEQEGFTSNREKLSMTKPHDAFIYGDMPRSKEDLLYGRDSRNKSYDNDLYNRNQISCEVYKPESTPGSTPKLGKASSYKKGGYRHSFSHYPGEEDPYAHGDTSLKNKLIDIQVPYVLPPYGPMQQRGSKVTDVPSRVKMKRRSIAVAQEFILEGLARSGLPIKRNGCEDAQPNIKDTDLDNTDGQHNTKELSGSVTVREGSQAVQQQQQQRQQPHQQTSAPASPQVSGQHKNNYTPNKIANLLSRKLTRITRSPKLDKDKKSSRNVDNVLENTSQLHESQDASTGPSSDMVRKTSSGASTCGTPSGTPAATPQHQRIVQTRNTPRSGSKSINNDYCRTENMLKIWILEVKGVQNKKRYYCNLVVDGQLRHCTVAKQKTNMCFWGEDFQINLESQDSTVCIELMRQADKKCTKLLGRVEIKLNSGNSAGLVEKWYPVKLDKSEREIPSIRIKYRFRSLTILPLGGYWGLREYLVSQSLLLCQLLEPVVTVKVKEDVAVALVNISQAEGRATEFLVNLILNDILKNAENEQCVFRGNSIATKAIEAYMRLVGEQYLQETLLSVVQSIISNTDDLEVDPMRIQNLTNLPTVLKQNQAALRFCIEDVWKRILQSADNFPLELRRVFQKLRERLLQYQEKTELTDNLISACVFLRFICPAILSPSLFNILQEYPEERAGRHLTLVAKTIQTLANFTWFHRKENYMEFLNDFIAQEQTSCREFLGKVSSDNIHMGDHFEFMGDIDLGKHLALLHLQLVEASPTIISNKSSLESNRVATIVENISVQHSQTSTPQIGRVFTSSSKSQSFNNLKSDTIDKFPLNTGVRYTSKSHVVSTVTLSNIIQQQPPSHIQNQPDVVLAATSTNSSNKNFGLKFDNRETDLPENVTPISTIESRTSSKDSALSRTESTSMDLPTVTSINEHDPFPTSSNDYSEFYNSLDSWTLKMRDLCMDGESNTNSQGSQTSISQLSNTASSGYQSFSYSQSSSPIDSAHRTEKLTSSYENKLNKMLDAKTVLAKTLQDVLPPDNLREPRTSSLPATKRHSRRISLQALPRPTTQLKNKGSISSSPSSSHSIEDLSRLRGHRIKHLPAAISSSDADNDSSPERQHSRRKRVAKSACSSAQPVSSSSSNPVWHIHQLRSRKHSSRKERHNRSCDPDENNLDGSKDDSSRVTAVKEEVVSSTIIQNDAKSCIYVEKNIVNVNDSQNILEAQENQMKEIVDRLMVMEAEFRTEQDAMRAELQHKEARINAQARKIAELDCVNNKMIQTIAYISNTNSYHGEALSHRSGNKLSHMTDDTD